MNKAVTSEKAIKVTLWLFAAAYLLLAYNLYDLMVCSGCSSDVYTAYAPTVDTEYSE